MEKNSIRRKKKAFVLTVILVFSSVVIIAPVQGIKPNDYAQSVADSSKVSPQNPTITCEIIPIGLDGIAITTLATTERYLYAGTTGQGVYKKDLSTPGSEWVFLGLSFECVNSIYVDPSFPQILYAGLNIIDIEINDEGFPHSLYRSYNGGTSWAPCDTGIDDINTLGNTIRLPVFCIKGVPGNPLILYAASQDYLFKSIDGGNHWIQVYGDSYRFGVQNVVTIDPSNPNNLWLGGESNEHMIGIRKSTDGGQTWTSATPSFFGASSNACDSIAVHPQNSNIVYVGCEGVLLKTTNGGMTWQIFLEGSAYFYGLLIDPLQPSHIYAGGDENTQNDFNIWEYFDPGNPALATGAWNFYEEQDRGSIQSMVFDRNDCLILYLGTTQGVYQYRSEWTGNAKLPATPNHS